MDKSLLYCSIHKNYPIYHINILDQDSTKLKCVKCISDISMQIKFLLIQDIMESNDNTFFKNWPPLSNEQLRQDINQLYNEDQDLNKPIEEFYDSLTQEIIKIISEKKKQQLILAQRAYELKSIIIEQYLKMASIDKIKECFIQENQKVEKIEQDLQEQINSQFQKKEEYTLKLSCMMKKYQLISKIDYQRTAQLKQNILEILKIINLLPENNNNFGDEINASTLNNFDSQLLKVEEELENNKKYQIKVDNLIAQLDICNKQLIQKINQSDWLLEDFLKEQQTLLLDTQINQAEFLEDIYKNAKELKNIMAQKFLDLGQTKFKYFNTFKYYLNLSDNTFLFSNYDFSYNYIKADIISKLLVYRFQTGQSHVQCFLNYQLNPKKKYLFKINFKKYNLNSEFYLGLANLQNIDSQYFGQEGLGFKIGKEQQQSSSFGLPLYNNLNVLQQIFDFEKEMSFTLQLKICLEDKLIQCQNDNNKSKIYKVQNQDVIKLDQKYLLGFQFLNDYLGDSIQIQNYEELDEFPIDQVIQGNKQNNQLIS
ncbi:hypothetical protein ABPG74_006605 [Tetrahymena malaccensis]